MTESIPQSSAIPIPIKPTALELRKIFSNNSLVGSLPCYSRFANRPTSTTSRYLNSLNDLRQLRSRSSEPNLIEYERDNKNTQQTIVISSQSGSKSNQIILKSSFSDQNLTTNINTDKRNFNCSLQYSDEPLGYESDFKKNEEIQFRDNNSIMSSNNSGSSGCRRRKLPQIPIRNTQSLYIPNVEETPYTVNQSPSKFGKSYSVDSNEHDAMSQSYNFTYDQSNYSDQLSANNWVSNNLFHNPYEIRNPPDSNEFGIQNENLNFIGNYQCSYDNQYNLNQFNDNNYMIPNNQLNPLIPKEDVKERRYSRENLKLDLKINKPAIKSDTIGSIIDNVRSQMLFKSDLPLNNEERRSSLKLELEGKVFSPPKISDAKIISENKVEQPSKNLFQKCRSRSSENSRSEKEESNEDDEEVVDDVFENKKSKAVTSLSRERNASFSGKDKPKQTRGRRSSSLEGVVALRSRSKSRNDSNKSSRNSSVSINENPQYFEYNPSPKLTKSGKIVSSAAIAKLRTTPSRGSLKKPSPKNSTSTKSSPKKRSDYDRTSRVKEGGHRDSFKKNDRTNQHDIVSDREQKDLNRSLSNADTNLEDRIGEFYFQGMET